MCATEATYKLLWSAASFRTGQRCSAGRGATGNYREHWCITILDTLRMIKHIFDIVMYWFFQNLSIFSREYLLSALGVYLLLFHVPTVFLHLMEILLFYEWNKAQLNSNTQLKLSLNNIWNITKFKPHANHLSLLAPRVWSKALAPKWQR